MRHSRRGRRQLRAAGLVLALVAAQFLLPVPLVGDPAAAEAWSESCTENGVTWQVDFTYTTDFGGVVELDSLTRIEDGASTDASNLVWELRWGLDPAEWGQPPDGAPTAGPHHAVRGTLTDLGGLRSVFTSPRLVTPDGACQVYLTPFANIDGTVGWPRVAVLGDSLVQQLNSTTVNEDYRQGFVEEELNRFGTLAEVEGQAGARWVGDSETDPLDQSESHLLDEYRGLLEHDAAGFVVALGVYDALYIADGATQAEREARRDEVYAELPGVLGEMMDRTPCLQVVTVPEGASSLDPDYAWAAEQVNNFFQWVISPSDSSDGVELFDFAQEAASEPWFGPDGVHLNEAGRQAFAETLGEAGRRCTEGTVLWGAPGTLDRGALAGATSLPSGMAFRAQEVTDWQFEPAKGPHFSTVTADGTLFFMSAATSGNVFYEGGEGFQLHAFNPDEGTFSVVPIKTDRNQEVPERTCEPPYDDPWTGGAWCGPEHLDRLAYGSGDVDVIHDGTTVIATGYGTYGGQDIETEGQFPVFAAVTPTGDGGWEVAEGPDADGDGLPDWRNAWSPRELYDLVPPSAHARFDQFCEEGGHTSRFDPEGRPVRDCPWTNEITVLPESGHVVVAHYPEPGLTVLDVGEPGADGRVTLDVTEVYVMPEVTHPEDPNETLGYAVREVQADPTSSLGDERFGVEFDFTPGFIEYSYDPGAPLGERLTPASAPVLSGELTGPDDDGMRSYMGYSQFVYDNDGNLWVPTGASRWGGPRQGVKVYANSPSGRKITRPECLETGPDGQPLPVEDYVLTPTGPDVRPAWGHVCTPDYNLYQPRPLANPWGVALDPATGWVVMGSWPQGESIAMRAQGGGPELSFEVGNATHPLGNQVTDEELAGPCLTWNVLNFGDPEDPNDTGDYPLPELDPTGDPCTGGTGRQAIQGPVDAQGRLWYGVRNAVPANLQGDAYALSMHRFDQWAYSVDVSRLTGRVAHSFSARSGQATVVQAEQYGTFDTVQQPGSVAVTDVHSIAGITACQQHRNGYGLSCDDPVTGIAGGGYALGNPAGNTTDGYGVGPGALAEYRIVVPKDGTYQLAYRATDRNQSGNQSIQLLVNGQSHQTSIHCPAADPGCDATHMQTIDGPMLDLPAGTHTVQVTAPAGSEGWELDWLRFTRLS